MAMQAPTIVARRYELHDLVGQGGCGAVYRATDRSNGSTVAVKMLTGAARQDRSFVERLVREQQALQALSGTHAVGAIDLCRGSGGALCLVMEWLEGIDLEQRLTELEADRQRMSAEELLRILAPVLETLERAHELGIVHRDIKPANVFLLSEGRGVRLLDFGLSRLKSSVTLTAVDTVMGSPSYIAPEAWQEGSKAIGRQADLYAAAVIVYRALAGRVPFEGRSLLETMQLATKSDRPSLHTDRPDLPPAVDEWLQLALAIDPEQRFQYASTFLASLRAVLGGLPIPEYTLPATRSGVTSIPPPATTASERQNAVAVALGRAASLLKRFAKSISRGPVPDATPAARSSAHESSGTRSLPKPPNPPASLPKPRLAAAPVFPGAPGSEGTPTVRAHVPSSKTTLRPPPSLAGSETTDSDLSGSDQDVLISDLLALPVEGPLEADLVQQTDGAQGPEPPLEKQTATKEEPPARKRKASSKVKKQGRSKSKTSPKKQASSKRKPSSKRKASSKKQAAGEKKPRRKKTSGTGEPPATGKSTSRKKSKRPSPRGEPSAKQRTPSGKKQTRQR